MDEPSILDYLKSRLFPHKYPLASQTQDTPEDPEFSQADFASNKTASQQFVEPTKVAPPGKSSWIVGLRLLAGLAIFWIAQRSLEPGPERSWGMALILFAIGAGWIAWLSWRGDWSIALPSPASTYHDPLTVRGVPLVIGLILSLLTFLFSGENHFSTLNVSLLVLSTACLGYAFWLPEPPKHNQFERFSIPASLRNWRFSQWSGKIALISLVALIAYFRFGKLAEIPAEMNSDHAEKILDILRLLYGQTNIFFPNNGGREALQMYLAAGLNSLTGVPLGFMTLKTVSTLAGFMALPFLYLAGKEIANWRVGLLAVGFAGVAYWPNVVSRLGLRLPFYILFTALIFYFLVRGLRRSRRNDFILLGISLGLSMYGYSANRILPLVLLVAVGLYLLHRQSRNYREQTIWFTLLAFVIAGVIFLPLLRFILEQPEAFFYRTLTRMGGAEQPLPAPAWLIFLQNTGRALTMFSWSNGEVWTTSVPYRPALEVTTGALFWAGVIVIFMAYFRYRHWLHIFLLVSIPLLMLPSTLSLAFPAENPNLYRTGGVVVPVFLVVGLALDGVMRSLQESFHRSGIKIAWGLTGLLFLFSAYQGYDLVFNQYANQYRLSSWNTSEMGKLAKDFSGTFNSPENVWIMGFPYWVDTRLVAIITGEPLRDLALFPDQVAKLPESGAAWLFIINPADQEAVSALQTRFPDGKLDTYHSRTPGKDFLIYFVAPQDG